MTLGIYIQVPFCQTKCTYCNFHTGVVSRDRYQPYANAVCREIELGAQGSKLAANEAKLERQGFDCAVAESSSGHGFSRAENRDSSEGVLTPEASELLGGRSFSSDINLTQLSGALAPEAKEPAVETIYFGGGTPSLLEPSALAEILDTLGATYMLAAPEITLEADPETITAEKTESWLAAGFNRISLGVQSFNDRELQATGRMHRRTDIYNATKILYTAGFHNISMDLIAGLPHQTRESWETSITELLDLRPEHISIYMLEVDESSHLGKESLAGGTRYSAAAIPSDDVQAEFYESACARLAAAGYEHYEISNWALPGRRSRHNLKYWRREPYLGFGAGAHSFDGKTRWANVHDSAQYVAAIEQGISAREQIEPVTMEQALEEEFFLGLRQLEGIDLARIDREYIAGSNGTGARLAAIRQQIDALRAQGFVHLDATRLRLNSNRLTVSSSILAELLA
jgi:oxygen-independent coproporphyrinogen-3 oxidase